MPAGNPLILAVVALSGYLAGSIPFGLIVSRLSGGPDPRTIGSGNIGATNVMRAGGKVAGALTLLLDAAKGFVPALMWSSTHVTAAPLGALAGLSAVVGHCFPIWLRFRGGKGVATYLGVVAALVPWAAAAFGATWVALATLTRRASAASLGATWMAVVVAALEVAHDRPGHGLGFDPPPSLQASVLLAIVLAAALVTLRHLGNIRRLARGQEPRMFARSATP